MVRNSTSNATAGFVQIVDSRTDKELGRVAWLEQNPHRVLHRYEGNACHQRYQNRLSYVSTFGIPKGPRKGEQVAGEDRRPRIISGAPNETRQGKRKSLVVTSAPFPPLQMDSSSLDGMKPATTGSKKDGTSGPNLLIRVLSGSPLRRPLLLIARPPVEGEVRFSRVAACPLPVLSPA